MQFLPTKSLLASRQPNAFSRQLSTAELLSGSSPGVNMTPLTEADSYLLASQHNLAPSRQDSTVEPLSSSDQSTCKVPLMEADKRLYNSYCVVHQKRLLS